MKKFLFLALVLGLCLFPGRLLSIEYYINDSLFYGGTTNTQITSLTGGNWDNGYYDLALTSGQEFYFYGKLVTHLRIWTNGYVTFGFGSAPTDGIDWSRDYPSLG